MHGRANVHVHVCAGVWPELRLSFLPLGGKARTFRGGVGRME